MFIRSLRTKRLLLGSLVLILLAATVHAQSDDSSAGLDAFWTLDYDTAIEKLTPLAESGNAEAAYFLGLIHDPLAHTVHGLKAVYMDQYHDPDTAWSWYDQAIELDYKPAFVRAYQLSQVYQLSKSSHRSGGFEDFRARESVGGGYYSGRHASRLSQKMPTMLRQAYKVWRTDPTAFSANSQYLYLQLVYQDERISTYINKYNKLREGLLECGRHGDDRCYYYLGKIDLETSGMGLYDFENKYIEAWSSFYLAEKMGNQHAAIYLFLLSEGMDKEEKTKALKLAQSMR